MRLRILLSCHGKQYLPYNYNYMLAATVYKILAASSQHYSDFLHNKGYLGPDGKLRKLFTISGLPLKPKPIPKKDGLYVHTPAKAHLVISSPMDLDFIETFVEGIFQYRVLTIANRKLKIEFVIEQIEAMPLPEFSEQAKFRALSPIVVTQVVDTENGKSKYYLRPQDGHLSKMVQHSLIKKYETFYGHAPKDTNMQMIVDADYVKNRRTSRLVTIHQGTPNETHVKGFMAPFTLTGSKELMRMAWLAGVGDQCSMGFGCVEVDKNKL